MSKVQSVFFFCCPPGPPENSAYLHNVVALAEGLPLIGVETASNLPYWNSNGDFLLKVGRSYQDCDVVFVDAALFEMGFSHLLPDDLYDDSRNYKIVYNLSSDGVQCTGFGSEVVKADVVLKSHFNSKYDYPDNFHSWQFGLTNRMLESAKCLPFSERKKQFLNNFRIHHQSRVMASERVSPFLRKFLSGNDDVEDMEDYRGLSNADCSYWRQTGRRHHPAYFERLSQSYACLCFGGILQNSLSNRPGLGWKILRKANRTAKLWKFDRIYQFDSWRFWESLVSGCSTFQIDFERYGAVFPVMPVKNVHYIGCDFDRLDLVETLIDQGLDIFETTGLQGREWALRNYSPLETAKRFLKIVE